MSILITAATCPEAYRLRRLLNSGDIILADRSEMPHLPGIRQMQIPPSEASSFAHEVLRICLDHGVSEVYPLRMDEIIELAKARQLFLEFGILLVIPSDDFLKGVSKYGKGGADILIIKEGNIAYSDSGMEVRGLTEQCGVFREETREGKSEYILYIAEDASV